DQMIIGFPGHFPMQRLGQEGEDRLGEKEANDKADSEREHSPDQPGAQLQKMFHQRRLGGVEGGFVFGGGLNHGAAAYGRMRQRRRFPGWQEDASSSGR